MRFKITIRGEGIELRGYVDGEDEREVELLAGVCDPWQVIASIAPEDFDPFKINDPEFPPSIESSLTVIEAILAASPDIKTATEMLATVHNAQAEVIRAERALRETAEAELASRELHHFEVEQENARLEVDNARLQSNLDQERAEHESTLHIGQDYLATLDKVRAARSNHPECDKHDDEDVVKCGWKNAVLDIDKALS